MEEIIGFDAKRNNRNKVSKSRKKHEEQKGDSGQKQLRSVIDVADSSDDFYMHRSLDNNWSRYEEDVSDDFNDNEQMNAADFELLQNKPTSGGSHFMFKSEKAWELDAEIIDKSIPYFNLNLKLLNAGLETIPFYKQLDFNSNLFTRSELSRMDKVAEKSEIKYQNILKEYEQFLQNKGQNSSSKQSSAKSNKSKSSKPSTPNNDTSAINHEMKNVKIEDLDELLNMTNNVEYESENNKDVVDKEVDIIPINQEDENKEVMQEWLDGILDEK